MIGTQSYGFNSHPQFGFPPQKTAPHPIPSDSPPDSPYVSPEGSPKQQENINPNQKSIGSSQSSTSCAVQTVYENRIKLSASNPEIDYHIKTASVTQKLIDDANDSSGNTVIKGNVDFLILKMRCMTGLDSDPRIAVDMYEGMKGLAKLAAGLTDQEQQKAACDALRESFAIIRGDLKTYSKLAGNLLEIAQILVSKWSNTQTSQIYNQNVQINMLYAIGEFADLYIRFSKFPGIVSAVDDGFKSSLQSAVKGISSFNVSEDLEMKVAAEYAKSALSMLKSNKSDLQLLAGILDDILSAGFAAKSLDYDTVSKRIQSLYHTVQRDEVYDWYPSVFILRGLEERILKSKLLDDFNVLLNFVEKERKKLTLQFTVSAIDTLAQIALKGSPHTAFAATNYLKIIKNDIHNCVHIKNEQPQGTFGIRKALKSVFLAPLTIEFTPKQKSQVRELAIRREIDISDNQTTWEVGGLARASLLDSFATETNAQNRQLILEKLLNVKNAKLVVHTRGGDTKLAPTALQDWNNEQGWEFFRQNAARLFAGPDCDEKSMMCALVSELYLDKVTIPALVLEDGLNWITTHQEQTLYPKLSNRFFSQNVSILQPQSKALPPTNLVSQGAAQLNQFTSIPKAIDVVVSAPVVNRKECALSTQLNMSPNELFEKLKTPEGFVAVLKEAKSINLKDGLEDVVLTDAHREAIFEALKSQPELEFSPGNYDHCIWFARKWLEAKIISKAGNFFLKAGECATDLHVKKQAFLDSVNTLKRLLKPSDKAQGDMAYAIIRLLEMDFSKPVIENEKVRGIYKEYTIEQLEKLRSEISEPNNLKKFLTIALNSHGKESYKGVMPYWYFLQIFRTKMEQNLNLAIMSKTNGDFDYEKIRLFVDNSVITMMSLFIK